MKRANAFHVRTRIAQGHIRVYNAYNVYLIAQFICEFEYCAHMNGSRGNAESITGGLKKIVQKNRMKIAGPARMRIYQAVEA
jgi:hypothetical protein